MAKSFQAVVPENLAKAWAEIRAEVETIETPDGFIPEDVYCDIKVGQATLFFMYVDDKRVGWAVIKLLGRDLHLWQVHGDNGYEVLKTFRDEVMAVARTAKALEVTYGSSRGAWNKVAKDHGFKPRFVVYSCPVDPLPAPPEGSVAANEQQLDG